MSRTLGCACESPHGTIQASPTGDDQLSFLDPVTFTCAACGRSVVFFDSQRDGYDGRLNDGAAYEQGEASEPSTCQKCGNTSATLLCGLGYNIDFEEEGELDLLPEAQNYFDAIDINGRCGSCGETRHIGSWETA